jgi:hypothetical protein
MTYIAQRCLAGAMFPSVGQIQRDEQVVSEMNGIFATTIPNELLGAGRSG